MKEAPDPVEISRQILLWLIAAVAVFGIFIVLVAIGSILNALSVEWGQELLNR